MAITNIAVYGSCHYWRIIMLPYLAKCRNWQLRMLLILPFMEVAVTGNYFAVYGSYPLLANTYVAIFGRLPYNWQLLMLPFFEVTISGNYLCARSGNIGYYHSNMCIKCNNVMYMYNK